MSLLEQLRDEWHTAEVDVARAVELDDSMDELEIQLIEQNRDVAKRRYEAVKSQEDARRREPMQVKGAGPRVVFL